MGGEQVVDGVGPAVGEVLARLVEVLSGEGSGLAGGVEDVEAVEVAAGVAVFEGVGAGGVVGDHAADGGAVAAGGVGAYLFAVGGELAVELIEDDAGLDGDLVGVEVEVQQTVEVSAEVDDDAVAQGFTG